MTMASAHPETYCVWIVAEDPLVREGLAAALQKQAFVEVAGQLSPSDVAAVRGGEPEAETAAPRAMTPGARADAIVWDLGPRSLQSAEDIALEAATPVLALTAGSDDARVALGWGAAGAMRRDASPARIAAAVRAITSGLVVLDREGAATVFRPRVTTAASASDPLTPRELEVLQHLAGGLANKEIARVLGISEHTVKFHVNSILTKLGAQGRTEAVVRAARLGLVVL